MHIRRFISAASSSRAVKVLLAAVLAVSLCPGSSILFQSASFADAAEQQGVANSPDETGDASAATGTTDDSPDVGKATDLIAVEGGPLRAIPSGLPATKEDAFINGLQHAWANPGERTTFDNVSLGFTINLFDYDAVDKKNPINNRYSQDQGTGDANAGINSGKNKSNQIKFYASGDGETTYEAGYTAGTNPGNGINQFTGVGRNNNSTNSFYTLQYANQGIVQDVLSGSGTDYANRYPLLNTNATDKTTDYLFKPENGTGKTAYANVNHLFYKVNAGTLDERMLYDSNNSYAYYDPTQGNGGNFVVYNDTYDRAGGSKSKMKVGFFPFDEWGTAGGVKNDLPCINPNEGEWNNDHHVNHHLGMTLNFPIIMPYEGKIYDEQTKQSTPMVFEFSGDDDMWVFVDGKLVLDIGGIHQPIKGTIDFSTGIVQLGKGTAPGPIQVLNQGQQNEQTIPISQNNHYSYTAAGIQTTGGLSRGDTVYLWNVYGWDGSTPILTPTSSGQQPVQQGILGDRDSAENRAGTEHTLQAFYLERGGCDSNLMISSNVHLMSKKTASAAKEWDDDVVDADKTPVQVQLIRKAVGRDDPNHVEYAVVDVDTPQVLSAPTWKYEWAELAEEGYNASGVYDESDPTSNIYCDYFYYVREVPLDGFVVSYEDSDDTPIPTELVTLGNDEVPAAAVPADYKTVTVKNTPVYLDVTKKWLDAAGQEETTEQHTNDSVWVQLCKQTREDATSEWGEEEPVGNAVELNDDNSFNHKFLVPLDENTRYLVKEGTASSDGTGFQEKEWLSGGKTSATDTGITYRYVSTAYTRDKGTTDSKELADGGAILAGEYTHADAVVSNKKSVTKLEVVKNWTDISSVDHASDSVWVQLYKGNEPLGDPVELKLNMGAGLTAWTYVFENLDPRGVYTAKEGTKSGDTFTPTTEFTFSSVKYRQRSIAYADAEGNEREEENLVGMDEDDVVVPDAGSITFTNGPVLANIKILKIDADSTADPKETLEGATFQLYRDAGAEGTPDGTYNKEIDLVPANLMPGGTDGTYTTGSDGLVQLTSLEPGTYWLVETSAPAGFLVRPLVQPIKIVVDQNGIPTATPNDATYDTDKTRPTLGEADEDEVYTLTFPNPHTYILPKAGGPGMLLFLFAGAFIATLALGGGFASRQPEGQLNRPERQRRRGGDR